MRERVLVDPPAAEVLLDEVVADPRGGVERAGDVVGGDLLDERRTGLVGHGLGVVGPGAGVAVGLQLQPDGAADSGPARPCTWAFVPSRFCTWWPYSWAMT